MSTLKHYYQPLDKNFYQWQDVTCECSPLPNGENQYIVLSIRQWYPGFLVRWLLRYKLWKHNLKK
jgi:hypothetical protein